MKYLWAVLVIFMLLLAATTTEHMTNKDLISTLKTFGNKGTPPSKKKTPNEAPIYGPRAPAVEHPTPSKKPGKIPSGGVYPDIYGPEYQGLPGSKPIKSNTTDDTYTFNPDLQKAFPTEGEPQPFLTDFSKFLH